MVNRTKWRRRVQRAGTAIVIVDAIAAFVGVGVWGPTRAVAVIVFGLACIASLAYLVAALNWLHEAYRKTLGVLLQARRREAIGMRSWLAAWLAVGYTSLFVLVPFVVFVGCLWQLIRYLKR